MQTVLKECHFRFWPFNRRTETESDVSDFLPKWGSSLLFYKYGFLQKNRRRLRIENSHQHTLKFKGGGGLNEGWSRRGGNTYQRKDYG